MENHCHSSLAFSFYQSLSFLLRQNKTSKRENKLNYSSVHGKKMPFSPEFPLELPGCNREKNLVIPLLRCARVLSGCYLSWPSTVHRKAQWLPTPPGTAPFARGAGSHDTVVETPQGVRKFPQLGRTIAVDSLIVVDSLLTIILTPPPLRVQSIAWRLC